MNEGTIVQCIGAVVDVEFPRDQIPEIYDALKLDEIGLTLEVQQQLGDGVVRTIALGSSDGLRRGMKVVNTKAPISVPVGVETLGRIMDVLGRPIDERGPVNAAKTMSIHREAPAYEELSPSTELLETGIKVIDLDLPVRQGRQDRPLRRRRRGQDRHHDGAHQQHRDRALGAVGVRGRGRAHARRQRLLPRDDGLGRRQQGRPCRSRRSSMVYGQMNEPPGNRLRVALTGLTIAESFRDEGRDVLLFIDNIYRFTLAGTEVSALLGRMPSAVGYQPTLAEEMGRLQERITSTKTGSITSIQAVYVPADDLTDPSPATTFGHLDATVVLSRDIAALGIYPSVDPLDSTSRQVDPHVDRRGALQLHAPGAADAAALQGTARHHRDSRHGRAFAGGQARGRARAQDPALPVAAVQRRRSVHGLARQVRLAQGHDQGLQDDRERRVRHLPEQAFYMVGTIEEAFEKAKTLQ